MLSRFNLFLGGAKRRDCTGSRKLKKGKTNEPKPSFAKELEKGRIGCEDKKCRAPPGLDGLRGFKSLYFCFEWVEVIVFYPCWICTRQLIGRPHVV